jgi:uncharacterized protein YbaP (TraB family)
VQAVLAPAAVKRNSTLLLRCGQLLKPEQRLSKSKIAHPQHSANQRFLQVMMISNQLTWMAPVLLQVATMSPARV